MLSEWTNEKLEWYVRASQMEGFHMALADNIRQFLKPTDILVDIGSGPALIDFELANDVNEIVAIDINKKVLGWADEEAKSRGISNFRTIAGDCKNDLDALLPDRFDVAVSSFFGGAGSVFDKAYQGANRLVVFITHPTDRFFVSGIGKAELHHVLESDLDDYLITGKFKYHKIMKEFDFGQPLVSIEEARRFLDVYSLNGEDGSEERMAYIEKKLALIEKANDSRYPYRLPKKRKAVFFYIEKQRLPHSE